MGSYPQESSQGRDRSRNYQERTNSPHIAQPKPRKRSRPSMKRPCPHPRRFRARRAGQQRAGQRRETTPPPRLMTQRWLISSGKAPKW